MLKATIDVQKNGFLSSLQIVLHVLLQEHLTVVASSATDNTDLVEIIEDAHKAMLSLLGIYAPELELITIMILP